jgi:hypothetical protein
MTSCQIRKGFFTLRPCADRAAAACPECKRPVCRRHLRADDRCVECAANSEYDDQGWDESSLYGYRQRYWEDESYKPVSAAGYDAAGYDASDTAAFAIGAAGEDFEFEDDEAGLLDS